MIYLNGQFVAVEDAMISALDRGCLFGDGVYEVIPVYSRHPFRLRAHLSRLDNSLAAIALKNPYSQAAWEELILHCIAKQSFEDQAVYLHITRGCTLSRDFPFPKSIEPTVLIAPSPLIVPSKQEKLTGIKALSHHDFRWLRCDIKSLNLLPAVLMRQLAQQAGCGEVVLFRDGWLTEGAASNIFLVKDGCLLGPPKSNLLLPGTTYDVVLELAEKYQIKTEIRPISEDEVRLADELWMTSSTKEILAIVELDKQAIGSGKVGAWAKHFDTLYQTFKQHAISQGGDA